MICRTFLARLVCILADRRSPARNVIIQLSGDGLVSQRWVRDTLIPLINSAAGDGRGDDGDTK